MCRLSSLSLSIALSLAICSDLAAETTLGTVAEAPAGVPAPIAAVLNPQGFLVQTDGKAVCEVWLVKDLAVKKGFKPTLNVKYPFQSGQLIGVLRVDAKADYTDFRGQAIKPGVYTLRYGQQPQDGNHIGTSEVADFLVAIPAANDTDPKPVGPVEKLHKASAKTAGANHPAIFSLLSPELAAASPTLAKDDNDRWVLDI